MGTFEKLTKFTFRRQTWKGGLIGCYYIAVKIYFLFQRFIDLMIRKKEHTKFSVIIPTYNRLGQIDSAIDSVVNQYYQNYEIIIVDDGSIDDTKQHVTKKYSELIKKNVINYVYLDSNGGVSKARNIGIKAASGEVICYLDSDNVWSPWYLSYIAKSYLNSEVKSVNCGMLIFDELSKTLNILGGEFTFDQMLAKNYIDMNIYSHRKELSTLFGGFDEELPRLVDYELIMRLSVHDEPKYLQLPSAIYFFRKGVETITSSKEIDYQELRSKVIQKIQSYRANQKA